MSQRQRRPVSSLRRTGKENRLFGEEFKDLSKVTRCQCNIYEWNIIAAALHITEAIVQIIILFTKFWSQDIAIPQIETSVPSSVWERNKASIYNASLNAPESCDIVMPRIFPAGDGGDDWKVYDVQIPSVSFSVEWAVVSFFLLSGGFQFLAAYGKILKDNGGETYYDYQELLEKGRNPLRFIEYGISASLMLWIIGLQSGIQSFYVLYLISICNVGCQILGLVAEYSMSLLNESMAGKEDDDKLEPSWPAPKCLAPWCKYRRNEDEENNFTIMILCHVVAFLQYLSAYGIIISHFIVSLENCNSTEPPGFVYAIIATQAILFGCFGLVQLIGVCCGNNILKEPEAVYIGLSLTAKSVLGWLLFAYVFLA